MLVFLDMFTAVAEAAALTAVSEFHTWMGKIGNATSCTTMKRLLLYWDCFCLPDHLSVTALYPPQDIFSKEQKKISDWCKYEKTCGPWADDDLIGVTDPGEKGKPFHLYREYEKDEDFKIGIEEGESKKDGTADKNICGRVCWKQKWYGDGNDIANEEKKIETESAPMLFEGAPHEVEEIPRENDKNRMGIRRDKDKGDKPPPLTCTYQFRNEYCKCEVELANQVEDKQNHLTENEIEGDIWYGELPEFLFQMI